MSAALAFLNGRFIPQKDAFLPLHDAGFIFGATVTDLCRTFRHRLDRLDDHLARFRQSCQLATIPQPVSDAELKRIALELTAANSALLGPEQDLALVMFATPGPVGWYAGLPGGPGDGPPTLGMHTFPLPFSRYRKMLLEGVRLIVPSIRPVPESCIDRRIKHRSRLVWWLAEQEVHAADAAASALLLDDSGHVTETASANLIVVKEGSILTPPRSSVLQGISLKTVEEICRDLGIPFEERQLTVADSQSSDEAMLSCTSYALAPVSRINGQPIPWPGRMFEQLIAAWSARVGVDIRKQILAGG